MDSLGTFGELLHEVLVDVRERRSMQSMASETTAESRIAALLTQVAVVRAIGNTPLLPLRRFAGQAGLPENVELWLKAEWTNPGGSVKDRPALAIVRCALEDGRLGNGRVLVDST